MNEPIDAPEPGRPELQAARTTDLVHELIRRQIDWRTYKQIHENHLRYLLQGEGAPKP